MKLRGNVWLLVEAAELIQYARGPFGKMYTAEDVAGRILDAVDRALTGPSPSPPTCKQSLQVDPGAGVGATPFVPPAPSECPGCAKVQRHPGEGYVCAWHMTAPAVPPAEPGKPATCICAKLSVDHIIPPPRKGHFIDCTAHPAHEEWARVHAGRATPEKGGT